MFHPNPTETNEAFKESISQQNSKFESISSPKNDGNTIGLNSLISEPPVSTPWAIFELIKDES